ncbi:MAG: hypothetical protein IIC24_07725, partial [Chloroflexi bacterium]|nr:hypothetical protein [Chloroflexota bacterium]
MRQRSYGKDTGLTLRMKNGWNVRWYPFSEYPISDACWSLSVGPDGRIYIAA